jgi:hypothetical protein
MTRTDDGENLELVKHDVFYEPDEALRSLGLA